jgi:hypothetical protein
VGSALKAESIDALSTPCPDTALAAQPIVIALFSSTMHFFLDGSRDVQPHGVAIGAMISRERA